MESDHYKKSAVMVCPHVHMSLRFLAQARSLQVLRVHQRVDKSGDTKERKHSSVVEKMLLAHARVRSACQLRYPSADQSQKRHHHSDRHEKVNLVWVQLLHAEL